MALPTGAKKRRPANAPSAAGTRSDLQGSMNDLGSSCFRRGALGMGQQIDGEQAGNHNNAVWASLALTAAGTYDVPHKLGHKPVAVRLERIEYPLNAAPPHVSIQPVDPANWTETAIRVDVFVITGTITGCQAWFTVRGA